MRLPVALIAFCGAIVLAALCSSASPLGVAASAAERAAACPTRSQAAALPRRPGGGLLRGDIYGDGYSDTVSIRYALGAPSSCGFLLVAETRRGARSVRVPESYKAEDLSVNQWPWREPFVAAIVRLGVRGSQIVVAREEGASVVDVSLYGIVDGKLRLLRFQPAVYQSELSLFGTVGTGSTNVRCLRGGALIVLSVSPTTATGKRFEFSRSTYRLGRHGFTRTGTRTVVGTDAYISALAQRSGFNRLPFTGCTVARGQRL